MSTELRCQGLVLKVHEAGESDLRVWIYTDLHGKQSLRAPAARKSKRRFIGLSNSFSLHHIAFRHRQRGGPLLLRTEAQQLRHSLRTDLSAFAACSYACELLLRLTEENDPNPLLFELLCSFLDYCEAQPLTPKLLCRFHLRLFQELGFQPNWDLCMECGSTLRSDSHFDLSQGGLLCGSCPRTPFAAGIGANTRELLSALQHKKRPPHDHPMHWQAAIKLLDARITHLLGSPPRSRDFLRQMVEF